MSSQSSAESPQTAISLRFSGRGRLDHTGATPGWFYHSGAALETIELITDSP